MRRALRRVPLLLAAVTLLALGGLTFAACNSDGNGDADEGDSGTATAHEGEQEGAIHVTLDEWSITDEHGQESAFAAESGEVTFEAHNDGAVPHELEVFKVDADVDIADLPVDDHKAKPAEVGAEEIGEIEEDELPAGSIQVAAFELEAGRYLLVCNIAGHYEQGMFAELIVN